MSGRKIDGAAEARAALAAVAASGQSRVDWAREHGVDARSLNAWRLNLARKGCRLRKASSPVRLVELVPASWGAAPSSARYVVRRGDFAVEVDDHFEDVTLRRLLDVLSMC